MKIWQNMNTTSKVYLAGGGLGSLAAAAFMGGSLNRTGDHVRAVKAFIGPFRGKNVGKMVVEL